MKHVFMLYLSFFIGNAVASSEINWTTWTFELCLMTHDTRTIYENAQKDYWGHGNVSLKMTWQWRAATLSELQEGELGRLDGTPTCTELTPGRDAFSEKATSVSTYEKCRKQMLEARHRMKQWSTEDHAAEKRIRQDLLQDLSRELEEIKTSQLKIKKLFKTEYQTFQTGHEAFEAETAGRHAHFHETNNEYGTLSQRVTILLTLAFIFNLLASAPN